MAAIVVHQTEGLIPIEAFSVMGLSAKPNSDSPIGKFGTGLKYSIAVLVRMGIEVTLYIGRTQYVFYKATRNFRGQEYSTVRMKKKKDWLLSKWTYHDLPFTTEYGKFWELWQVYRELHANTLDEGGHTYIKGEEDIPHLISDHSTLFVIKSQAYLDIYHSRDQIFLPDGATVRDSSVGIQVIDRPSQYIYFRGLRIMELRKTAQYTYNFLEDVSLTEDRTAQYPSLLEGRIVGMMQTTEDEILLDRAVARPPHESYEASLNHGSAYSSGWGSVTPSKKYLSVAASSTISSAKEVWNKAQPTVPTQVQATVIFPMPSLSEEQKLVFRGLVDSFMLKATVVFPDDNISEDILF